MSDVLQIDFANIEATINMLVERSANLAAKLYETTLNVANAEIECRALEGTVAVRLRESGAKVTEGYVTSVVDADDDVCTLRQRHKMAVAELAKIRADLDNMHDIRRMLVAWMNGQSKSGIEV